MMVDRRIAVQSDPQQLKSIGDFTDSLVSELQGSEGTPSKALTRELLTTSLRRALDLGVPDGKRRFLEALKVNIHKFALQEQQSLSRVYPVEISSEYANLQSWVEEPMMQQADDEAHVASTPSTTPAPMAVSLPALPAPTQGSVAPPPVHGAGAPSAEELRRLLGALPPRPGAAAEALSPRLRVEELEACLQGLDAQGRAAFFCDLRLNLFKLPEASQRSLVEENQELRTEVARLVESMTQEISRWLDEERAASKHGATGPLLAKLRALFQAILSAPFLATFRHLGGEERKSKEAFLLKVALCLRTCANKRFTDVPEVGEQAAQLRKQFFFVGGYGELMEDWLNNRIKQLNEEFARRCEAVLGRSIAAVAARLRRTFRPGRWLSLADPQLEEDISSLFLDDTFPRHVLTTASIGSMLKKVSSFGAGDFHLYADIARLPPARHQPSNPPPQDGTEVKLLEVLQKFPPFPSLKRLRPGVFLFGHTEVEFALRGNDLVARPNISSGAASGQLPPETSAEEFFQIRGPEEYPSAASMAVQSSEQSPAGSPSTTIEAHVHSQPQVAPPASGLAGNANQGGAASSAAGLLGQAQALTPPLGPLLSSLPPLSGPLSATPGGPVGPRTAPGLGTSLPPPPPPAASRRYDPYPAVGQPQQPQLFGSATMAAPPPLPGLPPSGSMPAPTGGTVFGLDDDEI